MHTGIPKLLYRVDGYNSSSDESSDYEDGEIVNPPCRRRKHEDGYHHQQTNMSNGLGLHHKHRCVVEVLSSDNGSEDDEEVDGDEDDNDDDDDGVDGDYSDEEEEDVTQSDGSHSDGSHSDRSHSDGSYSGNITVFPLLPVQSSVASPSHLYLGKVKIMFMILQHSLFHLPLHHPHHPHQFDTKQVRRMIFCQVTMMMLLYWMIQIPVVVVPKFIALIHPFGHHPPAPPVFT